MVDAIRNFQAAKTIEWLRCRHWWSHIRSGWQFFEFSTASYLFWLFTLHRGYYMSARGYEFYLWVFNSTSHEWAQMSSWTREDKIHIHKRHVIFFYYINILMTTSLTIFRTFRHFPKIFQNCSEGKTNFSEHFKGLCNHNNGDHFSNYGNANILTYER